MTGPIGQTPQSFRGYIGLGKESTYGEGVAPTIFVDATSDGYSLDNQPEHVNTTRSRGTNKSEAGPLSDEGSVDLPANPENGLGLLLYAAFGSESFNEPTTGVGEHTFTPADTLPSLSIEVDRDTGVVRHTGNGIDTFELSHTSEEMLTASIDAIASLPDPDVTSATPAYSDLRNFRFHDVTIMIAGADRGPDVQDLTFSIENGMDGVIRDERSVSKIDVGECVVTATATLDFETRELFELFLGEAGATELQDTLAQTSVNAVWSSPETIAETSENYALEWDMPTCVINTHEANIDQNDMVAEDVEFRANIDSSIGGEAEVTLTNGVTEAY